MSSTAALSGTVLSHAHIGAAKTTSEAIARCLLE
jgi:hypothetical protein